MHWYAARLNSSLRLSTQQQYRPIASKTFHPNNDKGNLSMPVTATTLSNTGSTTTSATSATASAAAPLAITAVAVDNMINNSETNSGFPIAGTSTFASGIVTINVYAASDLKQSTLLKSYTASIAADGSWQVPKQTVGKSFDLADGDYVFVASTTSGKKAITSNPVSVTLDTVAPTAPTVSLSSDTGISSSDKITSKGALNVTGIETNATVAYSVDNGQTWSATFTAKEGVNAVLVRQTDKAGNISASTALNFTLDTTIAKPTVALATDSGVAGDSLTNNAALAVSPAASDVTRTYTIDGGKATTTYVAPTPDGSHTVVVTDTDTAGNTASSTLTFILDTTPPTVAINHLAGATGFDKGFTVTAGAAVTLTGATLDQFVKTTAAGVDTYTAKAGAFNGETVSVSATLADVAGNTGSAVLALAPIDTTAPTVAINHLAGATGYDKGFTVTAGAAVTLTGATLDQFAKTTAAGVDTYTAKTGVFTGTE
ncbi:Ig-like domain-containing protein, partial [Massilia sp. LXY-6]|uniref:Ig-like domain-containing protein n=1 Tax=Massilia sp. LXY-6 TaxID=3379823 RepID=UPI003EDF6810